ncbi:MAG: hypothetical protein ACPKPY_13390 [Nitrososphaeraceae archaeon]
MSEIKICNMIIACYADKRSSTNPLVKILIDPPSSMSFPGPQHIRPLPESPYNLSFQAFPIIISLLHFHR